jgi:hypothetical protein
MEGIKNMQEAAESSRFLEDRTWQDLQREVNCELSDPPPLPFSIGLNPLPKANIPRKGILKSSQNSKEIFNAEPEYYSENSGTKKESQGKRVSFAVRDPIDLQTAQAVTKSGRSREAWLKEQKVHRVRKLRTELRRLQASNEYRPFLEIGECCGTRRLPKKCPSKLLSRLN